MSARIETALSAALDRIGRDAPPTLSAALRHAVFPGGARVRPRLCLAVAMACGDDRPALADAAGCAIELLHCASLVHDDLPCFDDAATRRGLPSVHAAFGQPLAVLVGDGLILHSFDVIAHEGVRDPARAVCLLSLLASAGGASNGLVAGQAWESETSPPLASYHRAKTGSLFRAAAAMGAVAAGADAAPWFALGDALGDAYQVADDLLDAAGTSAEAGKPIGQDTTHLRPSAVTVLGIDGCLDRFESLVVDARAAVPPCAGADGLRALVEQIATHLVPQALRRDLRQRAA